MRGKPIKGHTESKAGSMSVGGCSADEWSLAPSLTERQKDVTVGQPPPTSRAALGGGKRHTGVVRGGARMKVKKKCHQ